MNYKTVSRAIFLIHFAMKQFQGSIQRADDALRKIERELGVDCEYAIPVL
jgi:hypothetical protein